MITIAMKIEDWNIVMGVLAEGPFKVVAPLLQQIQQQAHPQLTAQTQEAKNGAVPVMNGHDKRDHIEGVPTG